jgi:hypothetical protein
MVLGVGLAGAIFTTILESSTSDSTVFIAFSAGLIAAAGFAALGAIFSAIRN